MPGASASAAPAQPTVRVRATQVEAAPEKAQRKVGRWLRLPAPALAILAAFSVVNTRPAPGPTGRDFLVSLSLAAFLFGVYTSLFGASNRTAAGWRRRVLGDALLVLGPVSLVWTQSHKTGFITLFGALLLLARRQSTGPAITLSAFSLGILALAVGAGQNQSPATAVVTALAIGGFSAVTLVTQRLRDAHEQAEARVQELERTRAAEADAAALAERQRLAREMHDVLAHSLSGLMLQLSAARLLADQPGTDPRLPEVIERAHRLGRSGLDEARRAIGMLRDDDLPGPDRLADLAERFTRDVGVPCRLVIQGEPAALGSQARLAIYRVAQEALTNITKHAAPERVEMFLAYESDATQLTVEDFGSAAATELTAVLREARTAQLPDVWSVQADKPTKPSTAETTAELPGAQEPRIGSAPQPSTPDRTANLTSAREMWTDTPTTPSATAWTADLNGARDLWADTPTRPSATVRTADLPGAQDIPTGTSSRLSTADRTAELPSAWDIPTDTSSRPPTADRSDGPIHSPTTPSAANRTTRLPHSRDAWTGAPTEPPMIDPPAGDWAGAGWHRLPAGHAGIATEALLGTQPSPSTRVADSGRRAMAEGDLIHAFHAHPVGRPDSLAAATDLRGVLFDSDGDGADDRPGDAEPPLYTPDFAAEAGQGYGLTGMRERAELLGGTLSAGMTRSGFRVRLRVPV